MDITSFGLDATSGSGITTIGRVDSSDDRSDRRPIWCDFYPHLMGTDGCSIGGQWEIWVAGVVEPGIDFMMWVLFGTVWYWSVCVGIPGMVKRDVSLSQN